MPEPTKANADREAAILTKADWRAADLTIAILELDGLAGADAETEEDVLAGERQQIARASAEAHAEEREAMWVVLKNAEEAWEWLAGFPHGGPTELEIGTASALCDRLSESVPRAEALIGEPKEKGDEQKPA